MTDKAQTYSMGDWIVHRNYGIGQIKKKEQKTIGGKNTLYYRVSTHNGTFWLPVKKADNERVRPLTTRNGMRKVIEILKAPPHEMKDDHRERRSRINQVKISSSLEEIARLINDLSARKTVGRLNSIEQRALTTLTECLVSEWSVCMQITREEAQYALEQILQSKTLNLEE